MLQLQHPARVSVVSQSENGECLSLDWNFRRINLVLAGVQNKVLILVSVSLTDWRSIVVCLWLLWNIFILSLNLFFSPSRQCWTVQKSRVKHPMLFWRVWGRGPATWSRLGPALWPATEPTARRCSSKHSLMVSEWVVVWSVWRCLCRWRFYGGEERECRTERGNLRGWARVKIWLWSN